MSPATANGNLYENFKKTLSKKSWPLSGCNRYFHLLITNPLNSAMFDLDESDDDDSFEMVSRRESIHPQKRNPLQVIEDANLVPQMQDCSLMRQGSVNVAFARALGAQEKQAPVHDGPLGLTPSANANERFSKVCVHIY